MDKRDTYLSRFPVHGSQRPDGIMKPSVAIDICFQEKYFTFSGRATRSEFWFFFIFASFLSSIINSVLLFVSNFFSGTVASVFLLLVVANSALFTLPVLSAAVRRLHDVEKPGWLLLVPGLGVYHLFIDGTPMLNLYGPVPSNNP